MERANPARLVHPFSRPTLASKTDESASTRKQRSTTEDFDSDNETEWQWSARSDRLEARGIAQEKKIEMNFFAEPNRGRVPWPEHLFRFAKTLKYAGSSSLFGLEPTSAREKGNGNGGGRMARARIM
jgi:hypothetical protein